MGRKRKSQLFRKLESHQEDIDSYTAAMREKVPGSTYAFADFLHSQDLLGDLVGEPDIPEEDILPWEVLVAEGHEIEERHEEFLSLMEVILRSGTPEFLVDIANLLDERKCCSSIAESMYRKALRAGEQRAANNLGCLLMDQDGRLDEAEHLFLEAISGGDRVPEANLARVQARQGNHEGSIHWFSRAVAHGRTDVLAELGTEYANAGHDEQAEETLRRAAAEAVEDAHSALAAYLAGKGGSAKKEAERHYRRAIEEGEYAANWNLAVHLSAQGRYDEAIPFYQSALRDDHEEANVNLAVALEKTGWRQEAERFYRKALSAKDPMVFCNYASFLLEDDRIVDAMDLQAEAVALGLTSEAGRIRDLIRDYRAHMRGTPPPPV